MLVHKHIKYLLSSIRKKLAMYNMPISKSLFDFDKDFGYTNHTTIPINHITGILNSTCSEKLS